MRKKNLKSVFHCSSHVLFCFWFYAKTQKCRRQHFWQSFISPLFAAAWLARTIMFPLHVTHPHIKLRPCQVFNYFCFHLETCAATFQHPFLRSGSRACVKTLDDPLYKSVTAVTVLLPLPRRLHRGGRILASGFRSFV